MQVKVRFLDNLRLEAQFDDFKVITDQPIRYKGDGSAPGPFDYFLASSALCAAYFVKVYCIAREIPTQDIQITQDNIIDPENRYQQTFVIRAQLPEGISEKHRKGIIDSMERCTVKRVIQNDPGFEIETTEAGVKDVGLDYQFDTHTQTMIVGKDVCLEETIERMTKTIATLGVKLEIASWRNIVPNVWSVHLRDADSPICFSNGKGSTKDAALCSALGEYLERLSTNYFYNDYYLGQELAQAEFVHYPQEKWFKFNGDALPEGLMDENFLTVFDAQKELRASHLVDMNSGDSDRGICALPYVRQSDQKEVWVPVNLIGNIFVSNGMSAGNTRVEARVQALSEIIERAVKKEILQNEISLPTVPEDVLKNFPSIQEGIAALEAQGFPIVVKDASLGGFYPVVCVVLMNPKNGGLFASFGAHPKFEVALERTLTELIQGRSFEGFNDIAVPTFNKSAVSEYHNLVEHFIDSSGVVSWKLMSEKHDYAFKQWNVEGTTEDEYRHLMRIFEDMGKEVYIADFEDLGAKACRILVPGYSEIYDPEELVWDNTNRALLYRSDILNIHQLSDDDLFSLLERMEEHQLDDYMFVSELIGVAFDENSAWGRCTIGELKGLICLSLKDFQQAKQYIDVLLAFNDNVAPRKRFFQALDIALAIELREDVQWCDYLPSLIRMYDQDLINQVAGCLDGKNRFPGLSPTNLKLEGLDKHAELLESYQKIQKIRASIKNI